MQDRAVGAGPGVPAAARAARRLRPGRHGPGQRRVHPHRGRVRQAGLRRPGGLVRRPAAADVPLAELLSPGVRGAAPRADRRRRSAGLRPGRARRRASRGCPATRRRVRPRGGGRRLAAGAGPGDRRADRGRAGRRAARAGDTCHLDVADRFGNLVSATPSGGWLQSSPVDPRPRASAWAPGPRCSRSTPGLRQLAGARASGRAPRCRRPGAARRRALPGVRHAGRRPAGPVAAARSSSTTCMFGMNLQEAIDAPAFHTDHFPSVVLPARRPAPLAGRRGARPAGQVIADAARARARRHGRAAVVAGPDQRGGPVRRLPVRRRQPARHAGLRGRPLGGGPRPPEHKRHGQAFTTWGTRCGSVG